jgi:hypothetical protein
MFTFRAIIEGGENTAKLTLVLCSEPLYNAHYENITTYIKRLRLSKSLTYDLVRFLVL